MFSVPSLSGTVLNQTHQNDDNAYIFHGNEDNESESFWFLVLFYFIRQADSECRLSLSILEE